MTNIVQPNGDNYTAGDDLQVESDVASVDPGDPLIQAWLTIKVDPADADPGVLQKVITSAGVQGVGQLTEDGSELQGNGTATLIFQITASETAMLGTAITYWYDIQAKSVSAKIYTSIKGMVRFDPGITAATA